MCTKLLHLCLTLCDPMDSSPPCSLSMGFSRQKYWSGLPCPPPGNLPNPGIEPGSPALQVESLPLRHQGSPVKSYIPPEISSRSFWANPTYLQGCHSSWCR